ncbi:MAG TPA: hypothetical protein DD803_04380 [Alcaligenes faecalis]|nr:hypothetical protein [Alcaligenes faecalis]
MQQFVINQNQQANGDYEVHNLTTPCRWMPSPQNQISLGIHLHCGYAVQEAKARWPGNRINGCAYCCPACHTS